MLPASILRQVLGRQKLIDGRDVVSEGGVQRVLWDHLHGIDDLLTQKLAVRREFD